MRILDLPPDLLARVICDAAGSEDGRVPFQAWPTFTSVCRAFRSAFYASVAVVDLADCYTLPRSMVRLHEYSHVARYLLLRPVACLPNLKTLDLSACDSLKDEDVAVFAARSAPLTSFTCTVCLLQTDASVIAIARSANDSLQNLGISGCDPQRHAPAMVFAQRARHQPCAALTNMSVVAISTFCRRLTSISLTNAPHITDTALRALSTLPSLEDIIIRDLPNITDKGVRMLAHGQAKLVSLSLLSNPKLGDAALLAIATGSATQQSLQFFGLSHSSCTTDIGIAAVLDNICTIDEIQLDYCGHISDDWTEKVAAGGGLVRVSVRAAGHGFTSSGVERLASSSTGSSRLCALNLGRCPSVNAAFAQSLCQAAPQIAVLVLDGCDFLDDQAIAVIGQLTALVSLDILRCRSVTTVGVRSLCHSVAASNLRCLSVGPVADVSEALTLDPSDHAGNNSEIDFDAVLSFHTSDGIASDNTAQTPASFNVSAGHNPSHSDAELHLSDTEPVLDRTPSVANLTRANEQNDSPSLEINSVSDYSAISSDEQKAMSDLEKSDRDLAFCDIALRCVSLEELVICGDVAPDTLAWLREHTRASIDVIEVTSVTDAFPGDDEDMYL